MINFFNRDTTNTRASLKDELIRNGFIVRNTMDTYRVINTMDTYRNYLTKAGYLRTVERGIYETIREIPYDLSVQDCRDEAYGNPVLFLGIQSIEKLGMRKLRMRKQKKEFFIKEDFELWVLVYIAMMYMEIRIYPKTLWKILIDQQRYFRILIIKNIEKNMEKHTFHIFMILRKD